MNKSLSQLLDANNLEDIVSYAFNNPNGELDVLGQRKLVQYCVKRNLNKDFLENIISNILRSDDYKQAEPFMEFANPDILLITAVDHSWPDGINYAIKNGAKNFDVAIYRAVQKNNKNLVGFLNKKKKSSESKE